MSPSAYEIDSKSPKILNDGSYSICMCITQYLQFPEQSSIVQQQILLKIRPLFKNQPRFKKSPVFQLCPILNFWLLLIELLQFCFNFSDLLKSKIEFSSQQCLLQAKYVALLLVDLLPDIMMNIGNKIAFPQNKYQNQKILETNSKFV